MSRSAIVKLQIESYKLQVEGADGAHGVLVC
jgi:hypothetical protein